MTTRTESDLQVTLRTAVGEGLKTFGGTQVQLARASGISEKHLSQILTGRANASVALWGLLLALLDVHVSYEIGSVG